MTEQNKYTFTVNTINTKKNHAIDGMVALKKIENFSYALSDEIGLGYSSHVYKGKNDKTNQIVAIKVIDIKKEDELHRQFTNDQISILQKIKSINAEHLLRLQGVFKTKNNLYIITEFCQGKDIAKILRKKRYYKQSEAQGIMKQFLKGYAQLYKLRTVHRDLKLANIFVRKGKAILADFGFAIEQERCKDNFDYNVGSPFYMPPESLKYNRYSYKSDVWAIGVIAYELIYGSRPWKDKNEDILFEKITSTQIDDLFEPGVSLSESYKNFIRECLRIDFDKRASPEFVINYEWNQADDYIDGLQQNYPPRSMSLPKAYIYPASAKNMTYKNIQFQEILSKKIGENSRNLNEIPFSLMPQNLSNNKQFSPHKQIVNKRKLTNFSEQTLQKNDLYEYEGLKKRTERQNTIDIPQRQPTNYLDTQKIIFVQIHYCRFLNIIFDEINNSGFDNLKDVLPKISSKIMELINFISKLQSDPDNQQIPGLRDYLNNSRWRKLSQMINDYKAKYSSKFMVYQNQRNTSSLSESVHQSIAFLKNYTASHSRLLEFLIYLHQILILEANNSRVEFSKQSKIEYLAESKKMNHNPAITERLIKKLNYLGF